MVTNWNEIAGKWKQLGGEVKKQWGELTNDELTKINGDREILSREIQENTASPGSMQMSRLSGRKTGSG